VSLLYNDKSLARRYVDADAIMKAIEQQSSLNYLKSWAKELRVVDLLQKALEEARMAE
jgi:hypothetical protein